MNQLINFLLANPILLIILIGWGLSILGGTLRKVEQKAMEARRRAQAESAPTAPEPVRKQTAEQVADEIRKMLRAKKVEVVMEEPKPAPLLQAPALRPLRPTFVGEQVTRSEVGGLRAEWAERDRLREAASQREAAKQEAHRRPDHVPMGRLAGRGEGASAQGQTTTVRRLVQSDAATVSAGGGRAAWARTGTLAALSNPAAAFVLMEVLSQPRAFREWSPQSSGL